jgi:hypothetical protein
VSLARVKSRELLVGWLAVVFNPRDQLFRRVADILHFEQFVRAPALLAEVVERLVSMGYGVVREGGRVLYEEKQLASRVYSLVSLEWRVRGGKEEVRGVVREHPTLKGCRLLKYYTYSPQTKYHRYCAHSLDHCRLSFQCDSAHQLLIEGRPYFKVRCAKVTRVGPLWRVEHSLNPLHLLVARKHQHVLDYERNQGRPPSEGE